MKTKILVSIFMLISHSLTTLASSERYQIKGNVELIKSSAVSLNNQFQLKNGPAIIESSTKPTGFFEKGIFILNQNNSKLRLSISKDRYKTQTDFFIPATDNNLNLDIAYTSLGTKQVSRSTKIEKETCHKTVFVGADQNNPTTNYATVVGTKDVTYKISNLKTNVKISFFEFKTLKAIFLGELLTENSEKTNETDCKYVTGIRH